MKKLILLLLALSLSLAGCQSKQQSADQVLLDQAEDLVNYQSYDTAREKLVKCVEMNPRNLKAYVLLGDVYYFQSNLIMFRMQILNLVFKYGRRLRWAQAKELDLATPVEEVMLQGMDSYNKALELIRQGARDETVEASYLNYELGWGYLAQDDTVNARKYFQNSVENGIDRWDAKSAYVYIGYIEQKAIEQKNQEKLEQRLKELKQKKGIKLKK